MKANIVFSGGGVKGAVLAGCFQAAVDKGIEPVGFGGTSGGSIVAMLCAFGYTPDELRTVLIGQAFQDFLDDQGKKLTKLRTTLGRLADRVGRRSWKTLFSMLELRKFISPDMGLYSGNGLESFLLTHIKSKLDSSSTFNTKNPALLTFQDLSELKFKPLRIVATDLRAKRTSVTRTSLNCKMRNSLL